MDNIAEKNWEKRHHLSIILAIVLIFVVIGGAAVALASSPAYGVQKLLQADQYERAIYQYNEYVSDRPVQHILASAILTDYVKSAGDSLAENIWTYDETISRLEAVSQFNDATLSTLASQILLEISD
jgi:hypothetical protein